jgi:hypothetical protein
MRFFTFFGLPFLPLPFTTAVVVGALVFTAAGGASAVLGGAFERVMILVVTGADNSYFFYWSAALLNALVTGIISETSLFRCYYSSVLENYLTIQYKHLVIIRH